MVKFSEYFSAWVSAYYANVLLGRDFYTAVGISKFFGGAIAKYILDSLESGVISLPLNIIDLGANNANLLNDIRAFLEILGLGVVEQCKFIAIESNAPQSSLQNSQRESKQSTSSLQGNLSPKQSAPTSSLRDLRSESKQSTPFSSLRGSEATEAIHESKIDCHEFANANAGLASKSCNDKVIFYKNLVELKSAEILQNRCNVFIANEFFDALPCEIIIKNKMAFIENNRIIFKPCDDKKVLEICKNFGIHKGEIPLMYDEICACVANLTFIFIAFDYGNENPRNELTTRFFYRHKTQNLNDMLADSANQSTNLATQDLPNHSVNLAPLFGKCDMTYSVPFYLLDSAFERIGAKKILSKRQDLALIEDFKILDLLQNFYDSQSGVNRTYLSESNKIKTLLYDLSPKFHARIYKNF